MFSVMLSDKLIGPFPDGAERVTQQRRSELVSGALSRVKVNVVKHHLQRYGGRLAQISTYI